VSSCYTRAVAGTSAVFEARIQQRLSIEQRRAVLDALRDEIDPAHTVGEVFDAAEALGWGEPLGDLSLADLAAVLLSDEEATGDAEPEPVVRVSAAPEPAPTAKKAAKKTAKKTAVKKATVKKATVKKATAKKATAKKATVKKATAKKATAKKTAAKKKAAKKAPAKSLPTRGKRKPEVVVDERMSLDEAIAYFVPLLRRLGEATMQDLEAATGVGRRKLRFHIGQLVREGYLERHGMGRGTNYTIA
jgi:DNA-binding transcriptional ArsR family regulator